MQTFVHSVADGSHAQLALGNHLDERVEIGNNCKVILTFSATDNSRHFVRIRVGANSIISFYSLQSGVCELDQENRIGPHSCINTYGAWVTKGACKLHTILEGEGSKGYDVQIFSLKNNDIFTINSILEHVGKNTEGNILTKGIADASSYGKLDGMIKVDKNGAGAASFLQQNVLLLDSRARADANPELEIENNDVSSRHGATIGPLDEEKIFYLMARGIARKAAREIIVEGFLNSALEKIPDETMRVKMAELLAR